MIKWKQVISYSYFSSDVVEIVPLISIVFMTDNIVHTALLLLKIHNVTFLQKNLALYIEQLIFFVFVIVKKNVVNALNSA